MNQEKKSNMIFWHVDTEFYKYMYYCSDFMPAYSHWFRTRAMFDQEITFPSFCANIYYIFENLFRI